MRACGQSQPGCGGLGDGDLAAALAFSRYATTALAAHPQDADLLVRMEKLFGVKLAFRADLNYHVENFKIINALTGEEYR